MMAEVAASMRAVEIDEEGALVFRAEQQADGDDLVPVSSGAARAGL